MTYTKLQNMQKYTILWMIQTYSILANPLLKDINQKIDFKFKKIVHWLRVNKISPSTKKTEIVPFRAQKTKLKT